MGRYCCCLCCPHCICGSCCSCCYGSGGRWCTLQRQRPIPGHLDPLTELLLIFLLLLLFSLPLLLLLLQQLVAFPPPLLLPLRHQPGLRFRFRRLGRRGLGAHPPLHQRLLQVALPLGQLLGPAALLPPFPIAPPLLFAPPFRLGLRQGRLRRLDGRDGPGGVRRPGFGRAGPLRSAWRCGQVQQLCIES